MRDYLDVEADNVGDVVGAEVLKVVVRGKERVTVLDAAGIVRASKGQELARENPVEIAILNALLRWQVSLERDRLSSCGLLFYLVVLVLVDVELGKVKEPIAHGLDERAK